jgi:ADP-ribose pyrophosphatase YjhB (NUDIX family)
VALEHSDLCSARTYELTGDSERVESMKPTKTKVAVCIAVMDSEKRVLVTRRAQSLRHFPGCWVLPGGHLELGESLETGGLRELDEETGIKVEIVKESGDTIKYMY